MAEALPAEGVEQASTQDLYPPGTFDYDSFRWRITHFYVARRKDRIICSPEFSVKSLDPDGVRRERKWQFKLFRRYQQELNRHCMGIQVTLEENLEEELVLEKCDAEPGYKVVPVMKSKPTKVTQAVSQISILNKNDEVLYGVGMEEGQEPWEFRVGDAYGQGLEYFFSLDMLRTYNMLVDERDLVLKWEMWTKRHQEEKDQTLQDYRQGKVWRKDNGLASDFGPLEEKSPDVMIYVQTAGETYPAHRKILEAASPAFAAALKQPDGENEEMTIIRIFGFEKDVVQTMLEYVYWGRLDQEFAKTRAPELFQIADMYCLMELRGICQNYLVEDLNKNNWRLYLDLAEMNDCVGLKEKCLEFMKEDRK